MSQRSFTRGARALTFLLTVLAVPLAGCLERELKPLNPCLVSGVVATVSVENIDKVDLLFMVDNSISMKDEQEALADQFPKLIRALTTGDRTGDGVPEFAPAKDLHIGVVSSDLGLARFNGVGGCTGLGDDGRLQSTSSPEITGCSAAMFSPPYLTFDKARGDDPLQVATDFSCIAALGIEGCGYEQQLESLLKAVWPGADDSRVFVGDGVTTSALTPGNGGPGFPNGDFIREDSLIALVVVTDEEDCSSSEFDFFDPSFSTNGPNTRCYYEGQSPEPNGLFDVERYISSFKALRPGREHLVIFAGIVGVPERLVTKEAMGAFDLKKPAGSDAFFDALLAAPEMQETIDDMGTTDPQDDNVKTSCFGGNDSAKAYPPRRIVQVAKGFGANGVIQSICQDNFGPAIDAIIEVIGNQLGDVCLPRPLIRNSEGLVECNVIWELPAERTGDTPLQCSERSYLSVPDGGRDLVGASGGAACKVAQLAVVDDTQPSTGDGWYYDDFSEETQLECTRYADRQRITFTTLAEPPNGVTVKLECLNETQSLASTRTDVRPNVEQPQVGDPCDDVMLRGQPVSGNDACVVLLAQPVNGVLEDRGMFCHAEQRVCVQACSTDAECPAAWVCDGRPESMAASGGAAYCVNPTCGGSSD